MQKFVERFESDAFENNTIAKQIGIDLKKNLQISPHPYCGWRSYPNQKLETITINEKGLRSKNFQDLKHENNCILLGGSVAWGFGASSNQNIPSYLIEKILHEKYGIKINVINLAEQMYSSFEETQSFIAYLDELNPSLVITLSGNNDIHRATTGVFKYISLHTAWLEYFAWGDKVGIVWEKNTLKKLIKIVARSFKKDQIFDEDYFIFSKPEKEAMYMELYSNKISIINTISAERKIKVIHFLQPDLFFKENKSDSEKKYYEYLKERMDYEFLKKSFLNLKKTFFDKNEKKGVIYKNLLDCFEKKEETFFFDHTHVSDKGYNILCEKIAKEINNNFKL